jgi:hypothetical protein
MQYRPATTTFTIRILLILILFERNQVVSIHIDNLKETDRDSTSITVQWSYDKTSDLLFLKDWIGYKIKYIRSGASKAIASDEKANIVTLTGINDTKYKLEKLTPNTEYRIQISAYKHDNEEGPSSNVITVKTTETGSIIVPHDD